MRRHVVIGMLSAIFASACTTTLRGGDDSVPTTGVRPGVPYSLPMLQYNIVAKYRLTSCDRDEEQLLPMAADVTVTPSTIEGERRLIDYDSLSSSFKITSVDFEYFEGTTLLKSINAAATDKGPEVIGNVIKTAVALAKLGAGLPPGGGGPPAVQTAGGIRCRAELPPLIAALKDARAAVERVPGEAQAIQDRITIATTKAQLGALLPAEAKQAAADIDASKKLEEKLNKLRGQVDKLEKRLTFAVEWKFPESSDQRARALAAPTPDAVNWLRTLVDGDAEVLGRQMTRMALSAALTPTVTATSCQSGSRGCRTTNSGDGILYRSPVPGELKVCRNPAPALCPRDPAPLVADWPLVPQFGTYHLIRLHNGFGEDNDVAVTFDKAGAITSFKYGRKAAPAVAISDLAVQAAEAGVSLSDAVRTKRDADEKAAREEAAASAKAEVDDLQHQIDVLTKTADLAKLRAPTNSALAAQNAEEADLTAQVAILRLRKERKELLNAIGSSQ